MEQTKGRRGRVWVWAAVFAVAAVAPAAVPGAAAAQQVPAAASDSLRAFLVTLGPGAAVWERFGHNALWIHDPEAGTDIAYHYGLFDMSESGFLTRFLQGRMFYYIGEADAPRLLEVYRRMGRTGTIQELRLTRQQVRELQAFLEWNLLPENRGYRYDYFRDNCSTRVRDALDRVLDGSISDALEDVPTDITYRSESLSLTAEDALLTAGLDLGLGPLADQRLTRWDLAFIPMRLRDDVRRLTVERDGRQVPLVAAERRYPAIGPSDEEMAVRTGRLDVRFLWMLLAGLAAAGVVAAVGWWADPRRSRGGRGATDSGGGRAGRIALAVLGSVWGLLTGAAGLLLLGLWLLTDHEFAHANENLFQASPLALALIVLVPMAVAGRATRAAEWLSGALLALSLLGLLVYPLPVTPQATLGIIALLLPVHGALFWALARQRRAREVR